MIPNTHQVPFHRHINHGLPLRNRAPSEKHPLRRRENDSKKIRPPKRRAPVVPVDSQPTICQLTSAIHARLCGGGMVRLNSSKQPSSQLRQCALEPEPLQKLQLNFKSLLLLLLCRVWSLSLGVECVQPCVVLGRYPNNCV